MRHLRMVGLSLAAVFAITAIAATSASALPEFGQCYAKPGEGKYTNEVCTKKAKLNKVTGKFEGPYEWRKAEEVAKRKFSGGAVEGSHPVLTSFFYFCVRGNQNINPFCGGKEKEGDTQGPLSVECEGEVNKGEIATKNTVKKVEALFFGCKIFGSLLCSNAEIPEVEGVIIVNLLKGKLGWINKTAIPREVGIQLEPEAKKGLFAQFNCAEVGEIKVGAAPGTIDEKGYYAEKGGGNGIISPITPVNTMATEFTQVFSENGSYENVPSKFQGSAPLKVLENLQYNPVEPEYQSAWSPAAETLTNVNIGEEVGEIKAN